METLSAAAFLQVSGRAFFTPLGEVSAIDLGNCLATSLDFNPERKQHYLYTHGKKVLNIDKVIGANPKWKISVDEFYTPVLPYLYAASGGLANADVTQSSATAATFAFTSKKGRTFLIGKYNLSAASLTTPGAKVEGLTADYVIDRVKGTVYIPLGSSIADGASCVATFDCALVVFNSITAFGQFNFAGTLEIHTEDDYLNAPREIYTMPCNLSLESMGERKIDDFAKTDFIATATSGSMLVKGRAA